jgi:MFS family permease
LPTLARELHLSKLSAGAMTAAYPVGTLVGSIPGGMLAARYGPKLTVVAGLTLLGASTLAFGFLHQATLLDVARSSRC